MIKIQIQLSDNIFLTSSPKCYKLTRKQADGALIDFLFSTNLEFIFKEFLHYKIKTSQAAEFSELVLLVVEAVKEIKKCVNILKESGEEHGKRI